MKQYEIDCYKVTESYDRDSHVVAYVSNRGLAQILVNRQTGYRSYSEHKQVITIFDSIDEIDANSTANLIKSAKSKLTAAEIAALGL
jgi:hypothetical protein